MWFWRFWLLNYEKDHWLIDCWYKNFIEDSLWINIIIFIYSIYIATIWGYYACQFRKRRYHIFVYIIVISSLWIIPALEPVNTPIEFIPYHVWVTFVLGMVALLEICAMLLQIKPNKRINTPKGFLAHIEYDRHQPTGWGLFVETLLGMIGPEQLQQDSFTVGITGSWGSGKTTFYKLIKKELKKEGKFGICEFQPWQVVNY